MVATGEGANHFHQNLPEVYLPRMGDEMHVVCTPTEVMGEIVKLQMLKSSPEVFWLWLRLNVQL